ncbi:MAG: PorV/PorQ family protein [Calditrichales bacterium]|nr:MAG: PorV/PorQ family protein [Calditrichales bacterium]
MKRNRIKKVNAGLVISAVLLSLMISPLPAQDGDGQAGTRSNFTFGFGARAMGLGNAFVAMADDPTALYWNPAGLDYVWQQSLTFFHASLPEGGLYDFIGYAYPTLDLGTFAAGIGRIGIGGIPETNLVGDDLGTFSFETYRAYFGYGLKLPWDLSTGLSLKLHRRSWGQLVQLGSDVNATGIGLDFGIMYRPQFSLSPLLRDWSFCLNIQNLFQPQLREGEDTDVMPFAMRFGLMRKIPFAAGGTSLNILLDIDKSPDTDLGVFFGTEFSYRGMGKLRLGYNNNAIAFGAGVEYSMFQIDYAFGNPSTDNYLPPIHRISLTINFGMDRDEMFDIVQQLRAEEEERLTTEIREADRQRQIAEHLKKANDYFKENKYLDAIVEYQQVISSDPFNHHAKVMLDSSNTKLALDFQQQQDIAVTAALDKDRAEADIRFFNEHFEQGRLYLDKKQYTEALIEFNLAEQRVPGNDQVQAAIQTTRRRLGEDLNVLLIQGRAEMNKQNYSEALRLFSEARLLAADDSQVKKEVDTLVGRVKLQESIQQGIMLYDVGQYDQALQIFEGVLTEDPQNEFIKQYYTRTRIETLSETEPMDADTERQYLQGVEKFLLGKYKEAIDIWQAILDTHPYNKKVLEAINGAEERIKRNESQQD